jgi:acyl-[acyl-carrier-protein]-phospholipid O-acyltransferase/long-chain-fatty-acid--[acyl-carrier-protein] ligase
MTPSFEPANAEITLFGALLRASREHGGKKVILEDLERQKLTYDRLILGSMVLGARFAAMTRPAETVGVLLPNVAGLAVTVFGLNAFGRGIAMLNFTAGLRNLSSAVRTAPCHLVLTSRRFVETAKLEDVVAGLSEVEVTPGRKLRVVYLEDVRKSIGAMDKVKGVLRARFAASVHRRHALDPKRPAVILFTSGTEGAPKGVALTSINLVGNATQIWAHADGMLTPADTAFNPLPMFHSFGLTAGCLLGLFNGMKVVLYPSPLHYKQIPKLIHDTTSTVLFATDTFLQGYARSAEPGELDSVRYVIAGAERVKDSTRALWWGARSKPADGADTASRSMILEGYGATECSPVLACNLPSRNRNGSVGPLLPGIEALIEPVPGIADGGKLVVRGLNVMAGYITASAPGVVVPPADGWYDTGDIVALADGFVTIKGRAKRFAKIGGEMVSLAAVENLAGMVWPDNQHVAVAVADPRKGEQLVLVTDKSDARREELIEEARRQGMPELWLPRSILHVPSIPVLGSGKVDLPATHDLVAASHARS